MVECFRGIHGYIVPWSPWLLGLLIGFGDHAYEIIYFVMDGKLLLDGVFKLVRRDDKYHYIGGDSV